jgi:serine/threonine protein kinase
MAIDSIGKYVNLKSIGHGGMAEVYQGLDLILDRRVAIKVILPHLASEPSFEERFQREARLVASLRHPNIVQIYEFDVQDNQPYMVMEYLPGGSLQDMLRQYHTLGKRMPLPEIITLLEHLAKALDFAHAKGAVHRDIKPANILFSLHEDPVIVDFGIAKILDESIQLTGTGGVVGSPHYMSPEQASSIPITKTSDIYSFGVVLYEMAVGRVPFRGDSITGVLMQHLTDPPPPPRQLNPNLSPAVESVILKALAKKPADRYASAGALIAALKQAHSESKSAAISLDAKTLIDTAQSDLPDQEPSIVKTSSKETRVEEIPLTSSPEKRASTLKPNHLKPAKTRLPRRTIFGVIGVIILVLITLGILFSGGIAEFFEDIFYGDDGNVLLHTTLDNEDSILKPDIGIGGRFSLLSSDFVTGQEANGILFVRDGGEECQNEDFQEVSFPTWQGNDLNVNMEAGELTFWFQPLFNATDLTGAYNLFTITSEGGTPPFISLEFFDSQLILIVEDEAGNWYETSANARTPLWQSGDWVYLRAVWDAYDDDDSLQLFVDEVRVDSGQVPGGWRIDVFDTNIRINIGSSSPCGNLITNGIIDDLTIRHFP